MAQPISFRWDEDYIARIDAARGDMKRSAFVRAAVDRLLDAPAPSRPATPPGTTARGRSPKATHAKPDGPAKVAAAVTRDPARGLNANGHLRFCKCPVCQPPKATNR